MAEEGWRQDQDGARVPELFAELLRGGTRALQGSGGIRAAAPMSVVAGLRPKCHCDTSLLPVIPISIQRRL
ncbi:hypothetical protein ANCCAN_28753 [Ancylostoma caninum]|uniref:Uncharacterized protein n=1 Tax=Ancylostoma caninum TaxID=29170 RepID=A0A368F3P6_ANCCA|nr:hypothetical protein ANCCAN_28753 [Ancylostoma caninum]